MRWEWSTAAVVSGALAATGAAAYTISGLASGRTAAGVVGKDGAPLRPSDTVFPNYILSAQGLWLFTRRWTLPNPRAIVFMVHGLSEHIGRYEHIARALNAAGLSVYGMDHQGHGQSDGTDKHVERFHHYIDDYTSFIENVLRETEDDQIPRFIFGHSMGGAIALHIALNMPKTFQGVVLSAPALKPDPVAAPSYIIAAATMISKFLPKLRVAGLDINTICDDPVVVARAARDKLFSKAKLTARFAAELFAEMQMLQSMSDRVSFPYLLLQGTDDKVCVPEGTYEFHEKTISNDKTLLRFEHASHESFNGKNGILVINAIVEWLQKRLP